MYGFDGGLITEMLVREASQREVLTEINFRNCCSENRNLKGKLYILICRY